jgi:prolyl oligopeptidase
MHQLIEPPPCSPVEPLTEILHGVAVSDPYRWLEDQDSAQTRTWIEEQTRYARAYLDSVPERSRIRGRVQELLDVETCDSFLKSGPRYFFRKRLPGREQPGIYFREGAEGRDQLLIDPEARGTGHYTAVKPLRVSVDGNLLLYEVKQGGERTGAFEILDVRNRRTLADSLPHGYLRGFAFSPDGQGYYYVHEATGAARPYYRAAFVHALGRSHQGDREIFCAGEDRHTRLTIIRGPRQLGLLVSRCLGKTYTDCYLWRMGASERPEPILRNADYTFSLQFLKGRTLAAIDLDAPNRRIVEVQPRKNNDPLFFNLIPESDAVIQSWMVTADHIFVSYARGTKTEIHIFDTFGNPCGHIPREDDQTIRLSAADSETNDVLLERESFTSPVEVEVYSCSSREHRRWGRRDVPFNPAPYSRRELSFPSRDGTQIPISLVGRRDALDGGEHATVMTSYGGFGNPMTPQFSVLVAFLLERGFLFALPNIRGGSEFGAEWHKAARRRNRQTAYDDFLAAAEWLIRTGRTSPKQLAIFGGSNSGLLVAAAMTQRPELFRAVVCIAPLLDMLRYHQFNDAHVWKEEFGSADDPEDFVALLDYSPYHHVREERSYPATLIVSGDADQNCNPLHARKMTAVLQRANGSTPPVLLDYSRFRGHSPVLPLSDRIEALTDRLAFLCSLMQLSV